MEVAAASQAMVTGNVVMTYNQDKTCNKQQDKEHINKEILQYIATQIILSLYKSTCCPIYHMKANVENFVPLLVKKTYLRFKDDLPGNLIISNNNSSAEIDALKELDVIPPFIHSSLLECWQTLFDYDDYVSDDIIDSQTSYVRGIAFQLAFMTLLTIGGFQNSLNNRISNTSPLHFTIANRSTALLDLPLSFGLVFDIRDGALQTALMCCNDIELAYRLIDRMSDDELNVWDNAGQTALIHHSKSHNVAIVNKLLSRVKDDGSGGLNMAHVDRHGYTARNLYRYHHRHHSDNPFVKTDTRLQQYKTLLPIVIAQAVPVRELQTIILAYTYMK